MFTDRDNKPIDENNDAVCDQNDYPTPEDDVFDLDDYVTDNFPAGVNDGDDTYENTYEKPNFGDANYYTPLEEVKEHQDNNDE